MHVIKRVVSFRTAYIFFYNCLLGTGMRPIIIVNLELLKGGIFDTTNFDLLYLIKYLIELNKILE